MSWLALIGSLASLTKQLIKVIYDGIYSYKKSVKRKKAKEWEEDLNQEAKDKINDILYKNKKPDSSDTMDSN